MSTQDREELKREIKNDLSDGYYKMSQTKILALIGCTISICLTVFGGYLYYDREMTAQRTETQRMMQDLRELKEGQRSIQLQINNLYKR